MLRCTRVTHAIFVWDVAKASLLDIPGFDVWRIWVDVMHTFDLCVLQHAVPSALWDLTSAKVRWKGRNRKVRLGAAFR